MHMTVHRNRKRPHIVARDDQGHRIDIYWHTHQAKPAWMYRLTWTDEYGMIAHEESGPIGDLEDLCYISSYLDDDDLGAILAYMSAGYH